MTVRTRKLSARGVDNRVHAGPALSPVGFVALHFIPGAFHRPRPGGMLAGKHTFR
jgi:hypothetical protein